MQLRGYGKHATRSWYKAQPLKKNDYLTIVFTVIFAVAALVLTFYDGNRYLW